jgi:hypothetical protein
MIGAEHRLGNEDQWAFTLGFERVVHRSKQLIRLKFTLGGAVVLLHN